MPVSPMPLLMLPGLICDSRIFATQSANIPESVAFPGYGLLDDLAAMARYVLGQAPSRFALLGHSMGARIALEVIRMAPERVDRLALVSTGTHMVRAGEAEKRYALRDLGRQQGISALVDEWLPPMLAASHREDQQLVSQLHSMCADAGMAMFEAQIEALLNRPELDSLLPQIRCPTLVAGGSEDLWSPPAQHQGIVAAIPGARLHVIEAAGHMLPAEAPEALNAIIADWLAYPTPN